jgi:4-diphosphocytidyl-2C-methyl-D-erythritol kinase
MSGSGATIFALFDNAARCSAAQQDLRATGWWCASTRTLSRAEYRAALARI